MHPYSRKIIDFLLDQIGELQQLEGRKSQAFENWYEQYIKMVDEVEALRKEIKELREGLKEG